MSDRRFNRTLMLNQAADSLGFDSTTRRAMTHLETFITAMASRDLGWDDVPEKLDMSTLMPSFAGKLLLRAARRDEGFVVVENAIADPTLRPPLLTAYVQCLEIATPGRGATITETIDYLLRSAE